MITYSKFNLTRKFLLTKISVIEFLHGTRRNFRVHWKNFSNRIKNNKSVANSGIAIFFETNLFMEVLLKYYKRYSDNFAGTIKKRPKGD